MWKEIFFKGENALEFENDIIRAVVIPSLGGKIASIYHKIKKFELLFQNKENVYKRPKLYSNFEEYDAAGFDDAFPTIDKCKVNVEGKEIIYPDHGEIWSANFKVHKVQENIISLNYESEILPYVYNKKIYIKNSSIEIEYSIKNIGNFDFPCIWAAHYLVNCQEDMEIRFPKGTENVVNAKESSMLGKVDTIHSYPTTTTIYGKNYELNKVLKPTSNHTEKYYNNGIVKDGQCSVYYKKQDLRYILEYNKEILPYLGFWVTEGGFRGDYNCALEPTNGYYDSINIANKNDKLFILRSNENLKFTMKITIK